MAASSRWGGEGRERERERERKGERESGWESGVEGERELSRVDGKVGE
jgi:hypothetical protein